MNSFRTCSFGRRFMMTYEGWIMMKSKMPRGSKVSCVRLLKPEEFGKGTCTKQEAVLFWWRGRFGEVVGGLTNPCLWPMMCWFSDVRSWNESLARLNHQDISGTKRIGACRQNAMNFSLHPVKRMKCTKEMCRGCRRIWMKWRVIVHLGRFEICWHVFMSNPDEWLFLVHYW